jgi:hypothetical protein
MTTASAPSTDLLEKITGYWVSQAVYVAAKLGVADRLGTAPRPVAQLATEVAAQPEALYRLMRALASVGIFAETEPQHFALTPLAQQLRADHPTSLRAVALLCGDLQYQAWGDLLHSARTGACAYEHQTGIPFFDHLKREPEAARTFTAAMTSFLQSIPRSVIEVYDFSRFRKVVDVGGAQGTLIAAVLDANPALSGVLFDLPHVVAQARPAIEAANLSGRCALVGGDFFESVPSGGDLYILSTIIHDWDDERSVRILENCRAAMAPGARLLLVEMVIEPGNEPFFGKWLDLHMLVMHGGRDRTRAEYERLLERAGFRLQQVIPTGFLRSVLEAQTA